MTEELAAGAIIAGRYRLDRLLGEGGMGSVWAATHNVTRHGVALKFLKPESAHNPAVVRRFMREARAATSVNHPNVIQIHDIFQLDNDVPVMVMDLLNGESLGQKLTRERRIALPELARIMVPVVSAVGTAHAAGIVHRDLKPDNIFLARFADGSMQPKVLDFGIAKLGSKAMEASQSGDLTRTGAMLGTPYYMSPEQVFGEKDVDARADVWAIGVILYEGLSGMRPVDGDNLGQLLKVITMGAIRPLSEVAPGLPDDVLRLVSHMLTTDRERRATDLKGAFEVLKQHTNELAQSFSDARPPELGALVSSPGAVSGHTPGDSGAGLVASGDKKLVTADAFTHTEPGTLASIPTRPLPLRAIGASLVAAVMLVAGFTVWRSSTADPAAEPAASAASEELEAATLPSVVVATTASAAETAEPEVPDASALEAAAPETPGTVAARPKSAPKGTPPKPSAKPAASAPEPPAAPKSGHSMGGVVFDAPF